MSETSNICVRVQSGEIIMPKYQVDVKMLAEQIITVIIEAPDEQTAELAAQLEALQRIGDSIELADTSSFNSRPEIVLLNPSGDPELTVTEPPTQYAAIVDHVVGATSVSEGDVVDLVRITGLNIEVLTIAGQKLTYDQDQFFNFYVAIAGAGTVGGKLTEEACEELLNPPFGFTTEELPEVLVGQDYNQTLQVSDNGAPPFLFQVISGSLPPGLALADPTFGIISGTATTDGLYTFTMKVTDSQTATDEKVYEILVPIPPVIISTANTAGAVGTPYVYDADGRVEASGSSPITFSLVSGPAAMTVDSSSGLVDWIPSSPGIFPVSIKATNRAGDNTQNFNITVT